MLENKYVFWAITGAIGALCSAVAYFVKRNQDKMEKRMAAQEQRTREVEEKLNKTISDMPYLYTLREDFIRSTANHDRKLDQIISLLAKGGNANG
ncbi:MAG: hypothetical protein IKK34_04890 [Clostridia bacterium]|nr:hypothetical protein [Clostridia bacterium]